MKNLLLLLKKKGFKEDPLPEGFEFSMSKNIDTVAIRINKTMEEKDFSFELSVHNVGVKHSIPADLIASFDEEQLRLEFESLSNFLSSYIKDQAVRAVESLKLKFEAPEKPPVCRMRFKDISEKQLDKFATLVKEHERAKPTFPPEILRSICDSCFQFSVHDFLKNAIIGKAIQFYKKDGELVKGVVNQVFQPDFNSTSFSLIIDNEVFTCDYKTFNFEFL